MRIIWLGILLILVSLPLAAQSVNSKNRFKVARSHFEHGEYDKSIKELEALVKEDSLYIDAHYLMGLSYLGLKKYELAREKLKATIDLDPRFLPAYQFLGQTYLDEKKYPQAKEHFLKMANVPGGGRPLTTAWAWLPTSKRTCVRPRRSGAKPCASMPRTLRPTTIWGS